MFKSGDPRTANAGRIGGHTLQAQYDTTEWRRKGTVALLNSFERKVDPEGLLSPEERERRAGAARKAHFARLAYKSAEARRKRK